MTQDVHLAEALAKSDNHSLRQRLHNAFRILARPGDSLEREALKLREAISAEWRHRAARGRWFPWPTTDAPYGCGGLRGVSWREQGMLGFLGYHVGETNPTPRSIREYILGFVFEHDLPPLNDPAYYQQWDQPQTSWRLKKLADTIAALTRNAKRRDPLAFATAIGHWEGDLEWLRQRYYVRFFHLELPATVGPEYHVASATPA